MLLLLLILLTLCRAWVGVHAMYRSCRYCIAGDRQTLKKKDQERGQNAGLCRPIQ